MKLSEILEDYIKMVNLYQGVSLTPSGEVVEGGVYQLPGSEPLFVVAVNRSGRFVEVAPLSFCWPLATRLDLILEFSHPFSDLWIAQTDLAVSVPDRLLKRAELLGKVKEEDLQILKRTLRGEAPLPKGRRGRGYGDPVHEKFKDFEYRRYKFLIEELLSSIEEAEEAQELESAEVKLPGIVAGLLEEFAALAPAASSEKRVLEGKGAVAVFTPEAVEVVIEESLVGKRGEVKLETPEGEVLIFSGTLPQLLTVKGVREEAFKAFSGLKVEVER